MSLHTFVVDNKIYPLFVFGKDKRKISYRYVYLYITLGTNIALKSE